MLYLLYGDIYKIDEEINKIIGNIDEFNISKYSLDINNYKDILEDALSLGLFEDKKAIIVKDASIFGNSKIPLDEFEKYFEKPNPNTILIFVTDKLDERKKVTKLIRKNGTVKEYSIDTNPNNIIKSLLEDYKMASDAINKFIELVGTDSYNIMNELEKLKLYKIKEKEITYDDVISLTTPNIDANLFKLIDAILGGKVEEAIKEYHNMLLYNKEPMQILIALANKYRLMYQVKNLFNKGYTEGDIARELKQNPSYIYHLNKDSKMFSDKYLLNEIKKLANIDYEIKSGKIDSKLALELYILKKD